MAPVIQDTITITAPSWVEMVKAQRYEYAKRNPTFEEAGEPWPSLRPEDVEKMVTYWNRELGARFPDPGNTAAWRTAVEDYIEPWRSAWQGALTAAAALENVTGEEIDTLPLGQMPELWRRLTDLAVLMDGDLPGDPGPGGVVGPLLRVPSPYRMSRRKKKKRPKGWGWGALLLLLLWALD